MGTSKRDLIKRKHKQARVHIEKAIEDVDELHELFDVQHKQYSAGYENIIVILSTALEFLGKMREFI